MRALNVSAGASSLRLSSTKKVHTTQLLKHETLCSPSLGHLRRVEAHAGRNDSNNLNDEWGQATPKSTARPTSRRDWDNEERVSRPSSRERAPREGSARNDWSDSPSSRTSFSRERRGPSRDFDSEGREDRWGDVSRSNNTRRRFQDDNSDDEDSGFSGDRSRAEDDWGERPRRRRTYDREPVYQDGVEREVPRARPRTKGPALKLAPEVPEELVDRLVERKKKSTAGLCYGCGFQLQTSTPGSAGYVPLEKFEVKKARRQTDKILCERCQALSNGAMIPGVDDQAVRVRLADPTTPTTSEETPAPPSESPTAPIASTITPNRLLVSPEQLRSDLQVIAGKRAIVLLLVDLLDASGSFFNHVRELVGKNPVVLVGTKFDVLPKGTEPEDVREWLARTAEFKRLNCIGTFVTSSRSGEGVSECVSAVMRERKGRDVFVVGAANVGKTAFLRAVIKEMGTFSSRNFNPAAIQASKYAPVESPMPGTTLAFIPLKAFDSDSALFDTPGLHLPHRLPHMLTPDENKALVPTKKLAAYVPPTPYFLTREARSKAGEGEGEAPETSEVTATYHWGGLARIDVLAGPPQMSLAFYSVSSMKVRAAALQGPEPEVQEGEAGEAPADAPFGTNAARARGGLRLSKGIRLRSPGHRGAVVDIAISGVPGWVTVFAPGRGDDVEIKVWTPRGVEVYQRPPLPVPNPTVVVA